MKRISIYVKPDVDFETFVGIIGEILEIPLLKYETDRYDEYPAYEIENEDVIVKILGIPPDLDNLNEMFPDYYDKKDRSYQILILLIKNSPVKINGKNLIVEESYESFGENFITKLKNRNISLAEGLTPEFFEI